MGEPPPPPPGKYYSAILIPQAYVGDWGGGENWGGYVLVGELFLKTTYTPDESWASAKTNVNGVSMAW